MLLQQLVNGLMLGSAYSLIAIGYALIFGVLGLVPLAHGEVFMMGALIGLQIVLWTSAGPLVALIGAIVGTAVLGIVIELTAFRPIRARNGPTLTHVPVASLKSSEKRPSKRKPLFTSASSTNRTASPNL